MKILRTLLIPVMMVMAGLNQEVKSAIIPTLFNSGVDSAGTTVATGSVDAHYSLISVPPGSGFTTSAYVADTTAPIVSAWVNPGSTARWIGPVTDVATMSAATTTGDYVYQTSFDLTGFDETSAVLTGQWSVDDVSSTLSINNVATGFTITGASAFASLHNFSISSGFVAGLNTLQFTVSNVTIVGGLNPSGLVVLISGTANPIAVPEPGSMALLGVGAAGLALAYRRRKTV